MSTRARSCGIVRIVDQHPQAEPVDRRDQPLRHRAHVARGQLAVVDTLLHHLGDPRLVALVQPRGDRAQLGVPCRATPQLQPQRPLAVAHAGERERLVDHPRRASRARSSSAASSATVRKSPSSSKECSSASASRASRVAKW